MSSIQLLMAPLNEQFDISCLAQYPHKPHVSRLRISSVTVCIAAICENRKHIVAVCDAKLATDYSSADLATVKIARLTRDWALMYAADDISPVSAIVDNLRAKLKSCPNTLDKITRTVQRSFQKQLHIKAGTLGKSPLKTALGLQLLFFGFDEHSSAHISVVTDPNGRIWNYDPKGYVAIGSGEAIATAMLDFFAPTVAQTMPLAIYRSLAAKFMAETSPYVGKETFVLILSADGSDTVLYPPAVDQVRGLWEREGKPRTPQDAESTAKRLLSSARTLFSQGLVLKGVQTW